MDKVSIGDWIPSIILGLIGLFFLIISYIAVIKSKKENRHYSGFPLFGGVFIFIAGVISPCKWLCLLCFLDYGVWMFPYAMYLNLKEFISMKCNNLEEVRLNIDRIDDEIIKLIAERTDYVMQASEFKKNENGVKAPGRVEEVIQKVRAKAVEYGADPDMVEELYREMISRFINMEMEEFRKNE